MKRWSTLGLILLVLIALPGLLTATGDADAGKGVYTKKCAMCHGKNGEGNAAMAKMLKVEIRDLGSKEVQALSDAEVKKIITEGKGKMKATDLSGADVDNVIAFVRTLKK